MPLASSLMIPRITEPPSLRPPIEPDTVKVPSSSDRMGNAPDCSKPVSITRLVTLPARSILPPAKLALTPALRVIGSQEGHLIVPAVVPSASSLTPKFDSVTRLPLLSIPDRLRAR